MPAWGKNGSDLSRLSTEMWAILRRIVLYPEAGEIVCVIDALDECEASGRKYTINQLRALCTDTPKGMKSRLRFLVTSRSYSEIELDFKILTTMFPAIRIPAEARSELITQDINIFIDHEIKCLKLPEKTTKRLTGRLQKIEHRTYLWLQLIMELIRKKAMVSSMSKSFDELLDLPLPATIEEA